MDPLLTSKWASRMDLNMVHLTAANVFSEMKVKLKQSSQHIGKKKNSKLQKCSGPYQLIKWL